MIQPKRTEYSPENRMVIKSKSEMEVQKIQTDMKLAEGSDIARMPERYFVHLFLPLFRFGKNEMYPTATFEKWLTFAGGSNRKVDIIDENGEVLYSVPPMLNRHAVKPMTNQSEFTSLHHVLITVDQVLRMSPAQAQIYADAQLNKRVEMMQAPGYTLEDLNAWNAILARYNIDPIAHVEQKDEVVIESDDGKFSNEEFTLL